jgi:outer membrane lipoprotein-sorting protein
MEQYQRKMIRPLILLLSVLLLPILAVAGDDARTIAQRVYDRDDGNDSWSEGTMILVQEGGRERVRELESATKDYGELAKRYIRFTSPRAIADTGFLSIERHEESDTQYLFLPSLKRSRRIAADQKDRSFVNTDYTYEDMERRAVERDTHTLVGSEKVLGEPCWVLERHPQKAEESQYQKVKSWIVKSSYLPVKAEFYDKKGKLLKRFEAHEVKVVDGIHTVMKSTMTNLQEGSATRMEIKKVQYNQGLKDVIFTVPYLEKKR